MSLYGDFSRLRRRVNNISKKDTWLSPGNSGLKLSGKTGDGNIIQCISDIAAGPCSCVIVYPAENPGEIPHCNFPSSTCTYDFIYGCLMNQVAIGQMATIKVSGKVTFKYKTVDFSDPIKRIYVGYKLYPVVDPGYLGYVTNFMANDKLDVAVASALATEEENITLIECDLTLVENTESALVVNVFNTSGSTITKYSVAGIIGTKNEQESLLNIRIPITDDYGWWVIAAEDIETNDFGRAYVMGVCKAYIKNPDGWSEVEIVNGQLYLNAVENGSGQILWEDEFEGSDTHLALIRFPVGGSGDGNTSIGIAKAAASSRITNPDGQVIGDGETLLVISGGYVGLWNYVAADDTWEDKGKPKAVIVQFGTSYGGLTMILNSVETGYSGGRTLYVD